MAETETEAELQSSSDSPRMSRGMVWLLLTALLVLGVGYVLNVPIPEGYPQTWRLQFGMSMMKAMSLVSSGIWAIGGPPPWVTTTKMCEFGEATKTLIFREPDDIESETTEMAGVSVIIHTPKDRQPTKQLPGFVHFHGGGWTFFSAKAYASFTRRIARSLQGVVVAVDYRKAPDHPFPAAFDDAVAVTKYFIENAKNYGVDPTRVGVGGDSAGGNLATTVSMKLRDDDFQPPVKLQLLIYPGVQAFNFQTPSYQTEGSIIVDSESAAMQYLFYAHGSQRHKEAAMRGDHVCTKVKKWLAGTHMDVARLPKELVPASYIPQSTGSFNSTIWNELKDVLTNPYFSPLIAKDLSNLPPTYIFIGSFDPLRDEGIWYYQRLRKAGNDIRQKFMDIGFHGMFMFHDFLQEVSLVTEEMLYYLKKHL